MENLLEKLNSILINAKKSLNRPYALETVNAKRKEVIEIQRQLEDYLIDSSVTEGDRNRIIQNFSKLREETLGLLAQHIEKRTTDRKVITNSVNMDISELYSISKLIPIFTGKKDELNNFITNLELVYGTVVPEKQSSFFNFVFKSRLEQKVQNRVKQENVPTSVNELVVALKKAYKPTKTSNSVLQELTHTVQKGEIRGFADKIETLVNELNEIQISEVGESDRSAIFRTNSVLAFNIFKSGLRDQQIVSTIEASRVTTFVEALRIAEDSASRIKERNVFYQISNHDNRFDSVNTGNSYRQNNNNRNNYNNNRNRNNNTNRNYYNNSNRNYNNITNGNNIDYRSNNNHSNNNSSHYNRHNNNNNRNYYNNNYNNNHRGNNRNNNQRGNRRNYNVNQIQNQGNQQEPESTHQDSPVTNQ